MRGKDFSSLNLLKETARLWLILITTFINTSFRLQNTFALSEQYPLKELRNDNRKLVLFRHSKLLFLKINLHLDTTN